MRSIRHSQSDISKGDAAQNSDDFVAEEYHLCDENRCAAEAKPSSWLGDIVLAIGCFAVVTAAGQLPLTCPRLIQAISSLVSPPRSRGSAGQRETRENKAGPKLLGADGTGF